MAEVLQVGVQDLRSSLSAVAESSDTELYIEVRKHFVQVLEIVARTNGVERLVQYLEAQLNALTTKAVKDLFKQESLKAARRFAKKALVSVLSVHVAWRELRIIDGAEGHLWDTEWTDAFWVQLLSEAAVCEVDEILEGLAPLVSEKLLRFPDLASTFIVSLAKLLASPAVDPSLVAAILSASDLAEAVTDRSAWVSEALSQALTLETGVNLRALYQRALADLLSREELRSLVLRELDEDKIVVMETPIEGVLWLTKEYDRLKALKDDVAAADAALELRLHIVMRLAHAVMTGKLANHMGGFVSLERINNWMFELLSPEVFLCENHGDYLDWLATFAHTLTPLQVFYTFKKALMVACVCPPQSALWLVHYAKILAEKQPLMVIPTFHVNPTFGDAVELRNVQPLYLPDLTEMPTELPDSGAPYNSDIPITLTQQRCAQLPCFELILLRRHGSGAVRRAALSLTTELCNDDTILNSRQAQQSTAETSWFMLVNGGLKRAMKRVEVSTALF